MGCGGSKNEVISTKPDFKEDNENNNTSKNNDNLGHIAIERLYYDVYTHYVFIIYWEL